MSAPATPRRFCDLSCPHASLPAEDAVDGARSCRTFAAIRCALLARLVHKNLPCAAGLAPEEAPENGARKGS